MAFEAGVVVKVIKDCNGAKRGTTVRVTKVGASNITGYVLKIDGTGTNDYVTIPHDSVCNFSRLDRAKFYKEMAQTLLDRAKDAEVCAEKLAKYETDIEEISADLEDIIKSNPDVKERTKKMESLVKKYRGEQI